MLGNPTAEQRRFQDRLRDMGCTVSFSPFPEIHHAFGSKWKAKVEVERPGEWIVIPIHPEIHKGLDRPPGWSFEFERNVFLETLTRYQDMYNEAHPVPESLIAYYCAMKSRQDVVRL